MITKRTSALAALSAAMLIGMLALTPGVSQEQTKAGKGDDAMADAMATWAEMNAKGPQHEHYKDMVGEWKVVNKMWMMPGTPPVEAEGTATFELMLDGRFIKQDFYCDMLGEKYHGVGIEGYDKIKKKYVSIWMDDMSTGISRMEGTIDATGKVLTFFGTMHDPLTGELDKMTKAVAREVSQDELVFTMYEYAQGMGEVKKMEITYTR